MICADGHTIPLCGGDIDDSNVFLHSLKSKRKPLLILINHLTSFLTPVS
jgi:hypothetical protein